MPKPRKSYKLAERRRERAEAFGGETYPIEGLDGEIVEIPLMAFWSEDLTKKVFDDEYPGDGEVLRMAVAETWPNEADERLAALAGLKLQTGDIREIIQEVLAVEPAQAPDDEDQDEGEDSSPAAAATKKPTAAGKSRSSS
ncbi:hypothetical protein [Actinomadura violacea]|uniref:Tail assembly chaperone n=1 Tax=Actinomadura violacea TaxID=2819934 RepID=A0ABS3RWQ3_9ACTN|nr:hypothetical protein [Actinomadura violacea]MBO2461188.1 hypothetical protein [Actinomadura violacea]